MTLNNVDRYWHEFYESMPLDKHMTVNMAFDATLAELRTRGIKIANDDRAEALIAMVARYVVESENV